ncbi:hypothetical protein OBBRIDRAFT_726697 [Obba rivulosa]|uniref:Uncharacterized protein n=1 Tax=Obba rivulosa TaxID=1052685 RepID=A0A8E2B1W4_9APHY|nr:hypothetical protein OBBRIDRAFT_726697 [Obba rivulosa]
MNSAVTALIAGERTTVKTKAWLRGLTLAANEAAKALAWGSVLVGQASQDNEYGDISIWLGSGDYGKDHEKQILDAMGLSENLGEAEVTPVAVSPTTHLPEHVEFPPKQPEMEVLIGLLSELDEIHAFRVVDLIGKGGLTVHFLVGHLKGEGHTPGWAGLVGIEAEVK